MENRQIQQVNRKSPKLCATGLSNRSIMLDWHQSYRALKLEKIMPTEKLDDIFDITYSEPELSRGIYETSGLLGYRHDGSTCGYETIKAEGQTKAATRKELLRKARQAIESGKVKPPDAK